MAAIQAEVIVCSDMSDIYDPPRDFGASIDAPGYSLVMRRADCPLQFVLKVHRRFSLAFDHCYFYERTDRDWRAIL
jgi:hypothetical protein